MHYQNLPDALKQQKHFCLWKREMRKGNYTKVPLKLLMEKRELKSFMLCLLKKHILF